MRVFISHTSDPRDQQFLEELTTQLKRAGFEPWLDTQQLFPGDNWHLETGKALETSQYMIVVLSPESEKSDRQSQEISYALGSHRFKDRLISVMLRPTSRIPWILERLRIVRVNGNSKAAIRDVIRQLEETAEVADR